MRASKNAEQKLLTIFKKNTKRKRKVVLLMCKKNIEIRKKKTVQQSSAKRLMFPRCYCIKQIDSILPCVGSVTDHRRRQNVVRTSATNSSTARVPLFCSNHNLTSSLIFN